MTATQTDLFQRRKAKETVTDADTRDVLRTLRQYAEVGQRWTKGKDICTALGWPDVETSRRRLRKVAEANRRKLVTGDHGYCLLEYATLKEVAHAARRLVSQGRRMIEEGIRTRHGFYEYLRSPR